MPAPKGNQYAKGVGRPTNYRPQYAEQARKLCGRAAMVDAELADFFGVSISAIKAWKIRYPEFKTATAMGKQEADDRVVDALFHRAVGYSFDAEKIFPPRGRARKELRVAYREHLPPDTMAGRLWLLNRQPEMWRERQEITGKDGGSLLGEGKSLEEIRAELVAEFVALGLTAHLPETPKANGALSNRGVVGRKR
jgi:hypothetical protein